MDATEHGQLNATWRVLNQVILVVGGPTQNEKGTTVHTLLHMRSGSSNTCDH